MEIPIIGLGGITKITDLLEFMAVGATAIQVGTANFIYPTISGDLVRELDMFCSQNNFKNLSELIRGVKNDYSN